MPGYVIGMFGSPCTYFYRSCANDGADKPFTRKPDYCRQEHVDYVGSRLDTIGTERPMWIEYLRNRFPDLSQTQANEIIFYCLEHYVVSQPLLPPADYLNY